MLEETAIVIRTRGEHAWVEAQRQSTCGACAANKGCGTSVLSKLFGRKVARMKVLNAAHAAAGDAVIIAINEATFLKGSFLVYMVPLLAMLGSALFGQGLATQLGFASGEVAAIAFGTIGFALAGLLVRRRLRRLTRESGFQPVIVRRVSAGGGLPLHRAGAQN